MNKLIKKVLFYEPEEKEKNLIFCLKKLNEHIRGQFHVKGPRKKVNVEKWFFFNEMWKITRQVDDFGRLYNFCNFGVYLAKNQKYPKMTVLKKWKLK